METLLVIFALLLALLITLGMLAAEMRKGKQIEGLKETIREQELTADAVAKAALESADIYDVVGFLNRLHKNTADSD